MGTRARRRVPHDVEVTATEHPSDEADEPQGVTAPARVEGSADEGERLAEILSAQAQIVTGASDLIEVMNLVSERVQRMTRATGATVELVEDGEIVVRAATGTAGRLLDTSVPLVGSKAGIAVRTGQILRSDDPATDPRTDLSPARKVGVKSMMLVPLHFEGRVLGVLRVFSPDVRAFYGRDADSLQIMAGLIGAAVSHAAESDAKQRLLAERTAALAALQVSEERFKSAFDHAPVGIAMVGMDGRFVRGNRALTAMLGFAEDELAVRTLSDLSHPDDVQLDEFYLARLRSGEVGHYEIERRLIALDGSCVWAIQSASLVRGADGEILYYLVQLQDITARKEAEAMAIHAREEAERANRAKSEFLSRMSHELRTPLNAILGFGQLLEIEDLNASEQESVEQILKAGRHLLGLINEVLDISRIEAGRLQLSIEPVPVDATVSETLDLIRPLAGHRGISVVVDGASADGLHVLADRQRLKQVLLNLLSNAVKYNRDQGTVTLSYTVLPDARLRISVRDTGQGIAPDKLARLFNPFDRLGADQTTVEGTGLGLSLSKRLAEAMGTDIWVDSRVGQGTTFWIELPLARDPLARAEAELQEVTVAGHQPTAARRTVVYIEDNLPNLTVVERLLARRDDLQLITAMQGRLGLELIRERRPDVVLLDIHLPDVNGDEVLRVLKDDPRTAPIPVIVVSADATPKQVEQLLDAGARAYLTKPLDLKQFMSTLDAVLAEVGAE